MTRLYDEYVSRSEGKSDIAAHLPFLYGAVLRYPGAKVLELGVRRGNSTVALLAGVEKVGGRLWSVDVRMPKIDQWIYETPFWTFTRGNDLLVDLPGEFDVIFIDTSHEFSHTLAELRRFVPMVRPGGVVILHDTELYGVSKALDAYKVPWVNHAGCGGLGVIEVKQA